MKKTENKGFTLVELIIVITILAILSTIAFVSFSSYTADSRNAKVQSELGNLRNVMEVKMAEAIRATSFVKYIKDYSLVSADNAGSGLSLGGIGVTSTGNYLAGDLNSRLLGINFENPYKIGATDLIGGKYQIAGTITKDGKNQAYVLGNYSYRNQDTFLTGTVINVDNTESKVTFNLENTGLGIFNLNDWIKINYNSNSNTGQVISQSNDLSTITIKFNNNNIPNIDDKVQLTINEGETEGLIRGRDGLNNDYGPITDGGKYLPYSKE